MKLVRSLLLAVLAVCVFCAISAAQVVFHNNDGTFTSTANTGGTLSLTGSSLIQVTGLTAYGIPSGAVTNEGSVDLTTGPMTSGSMMAGGTFAAAGSSFTIVYQSGAIFTGSFSTAPTWVLLGGVYYLTGSVNGVLTVPGYNPVTVMGASFNLTSTGVSCGAKNGPCSATDGGGTTTFPVVPVLTPSSQVPEPGTLTLLGSGLLGLGVFARKLIVKP